MILIGHGFSEDFLYDLDLEHYQILVERHFTQFIEETMEQTWRTHMATQGSSAELKKFLSDYEPEKKSSPDRVADPNEVAAAFGIKLTGM